MKYIPDQGDIVWCSFDPSLGHEQKGRRPGIVLSHSSYTKASGLIILCPITSKEKGYPFEFPFQGTDVGGVVLPDQICSIDWKERKVMFIEKISRENLIEIQNRVFALVG